MSRDLATEMKISSMKRLFAKAVGPLGMFHAAKIMTRRQPRILMYHRFGESDTWYKVGMATFERQVQILRDHFRIVPLHLVVNCLTNQLTIPHNVVVLTIDDGYEDCYKYAFPILKKYSAPATIYVTSGFVDRQTWLWPDKIDYVLQKTAFRDYTMRVDGEKVTLALANTEDRYRAWSMIGSLCWSLGESEKNRLIKKIADDLKVRLPLQPTAEYHPLSWDQINEMKKTSIEIGGHTHTHARLTALDHDNLIHEINDSKVRIESMTNDAVRSFAYPHGTRADYDENVKKLVRQAGYSSAVVSYFDRCVAEDALELRRSSVHIDMLNFQKVVFGITYLQAKKTAQIVE
jgi:peptidoglycan/xylan/chitin deacetylase (PgdA/CDA1 family)